MQWASKKRPTQRGTPTLRNKARLNPSRMGVGQWQLGLVDPTAPIQSTLAPGCGQHCQPTHKLPKTRRIMECVLRGPPRGLNSPSLAVGLLFFYIHMRSLQITQKKEGRKGAQTLEKQGKKPPATSQKLTVRPGPYSLIGNAEQT
jgi:hypothetical protein